MDAPMFFGFVGVFNLVLLWPGLLVLGLVGSEPFELPNKTQWQFLVVNGLVGTVFSELIWLWGCFYTSSLVATLAISLTIPLSVIADALWKNKQYEAIFFVGALPMFLSFFVVAMLTHYQDWDPVRDACIGIFEACAGLFCKRRRNGASSAVGSSAARNAYVFDNVNSAETESLIDEDSNNGGLSLNGGEVRLMDSDEDEIEAV